MNLKNKTILITGAAIRISRATVLEFAKNDAMVGQII